MTFPVIQCATCVHFHAENMKGETCNAFPNGIPEVIYLGEHDHRLPFEGDNGIRYTQIVYTGEDDEEID
jgi:hypothetical protein